MYLLYWRITNKFIQNENLTNTSQTNLSNTRINHCGSRTTNQTNFPHPSIPVIATKDELSRYASLSRKWILKVLFRHIGQNYKSYQAYKNYFSVTNATSVQKLLEFYRALAPVCIGGPSSTTLELEPSNASNAANKSKHLGKYNKTPKKPCNSKFLEKICIYP